MFQVTGCPNGRLRGGVLGGGAESMDNDSSPGSFQPPWASDLCPELLGGKKDIPKLELPEASRVLWGLKSQFD